MKVVGLNEIYILVVCQFTVPWVVSEEIDYNRFELSKVGLGVIFDRYEPTLNLLNIYGRTENQVSSKSIQ
jgi:hypothetical protein